MRKIATTGIWKIEKRLDHVIDYTTNIEKTLNSEYGRETYYDLHNVIDYVEADFKTEKQYYVSGVNCNVETAYEEMIITKQQYNKTSGILGFHAFQSFAEGEVTPEQAHLIGLKLAEEMWGDRFEVIVSTHLNTKHYHNHFVINSVSFKDGKRYYDNRTTYARLRELSDSLCQEYGLSVLEEKPCRNSKINYANYYKGYVEKNNYYITTKADIDRAIAQAYSYKDFENLMRAMDYELTYRGQNILSVRRDPYKKNIRVERNFGKDYSIQRIKERIETEQEKRIPFIEEYVSKKMGLSIEPVSTQVIPRDRHAMFFATLGVIASSIERLATEIRHLQRTEVGEVSEYFHVGQKGSSAMPHKSNPVLSENLTGLSRIVRSAVTPALEDVVLWHERDISHSSVERIIAPDATITLDFALNRLSEVIEGLQVNKERMRLNIDLQKGLIYSQRVLLALVSKGMLRDEAYKVVQGTAKRVWYGEGEFKDLLSRDKQVRERLSYEELNNLFDPSYYTKNIDTVFKRVLG